MTKDNEKVVKAIDRMRTTATHAVHGAYSIDDKVRMQRLVSELEHTRSIMLKLQFEIDDSVIFAKNTEVCQQCGTVVNRDNL